MGHRHNESLLGAKYRDYCSARVADAILALTPDEIYTLAAADARSSGRELPSTYEQAINLATDRVRQRLNLPDLDEWIEQYLRHPERFDPYLMGLWREDGDA